VRRVALQCKCVPVLLGRGATLRLVGSQGPSLDRAKAYPGWEPLRSEGDNDGPKAASGA